MWNVALATLWLLAALLAVRLAVGWWSAWRPAPPPPEAPAARFESFRWPQLPAGVWSRMRATGTQVSAAGATLAERYRLAGTFLILADDGSDGSGHRSAILDERQTRQQHLLKEGEAVNDVRVVRVARDYVILSDGRREEKIEMDSGTAAAAAPQQAATAPLVEQPILESNRFGNRVGETRWEFSRAAVLDYYNEMMESPERLASLFLAMDADRDEEGKVAGFRLNMDVGEREFYTLVGFQDGDIVRRVNSMRMTSQRRAEYFIGEFVQDRLGAVVIDIERDGQPLKLVYLVD